MLTKTPLLEAINSANFTTAEALIRNGERIPDGLQSYNLTQLYETLISKKGFAVLKALAADGQIVTDVYELEKFDNSVFKPLIKRLPLDDESFAFLREFVGNAQNINDEVDGKTLLAYAFESQAEPAVIRALIDAGCRTDFKNNAEDNLICQVVRINLMPEPKQLAYVEMLIQEGVDVNETNVVKQTALHIAVERDKRHLIDVLLQHGAQPNEPDKSGNTAFFYALAHKFDRVVYEKLSGHTPADFSLLNKDGQTPLSEFLRMMRGGANDIALLEQLLADGADLDDATPYYSKPRSGWDWIIEKPTEVLQMALRKTGVDVNHPDNDGNTLLHKVCAINPNYEQNKAREIYKKAKMLLDAGADPTLTNTQDKKAMDLAAGDNLKAKTVEILLAAEKK
ncbi:ankyrin repeat domain-containing protein [Dawidia soli]|uniref:Ankyrin repeat domain-containing protein n=1 Tax=Dawidia soli TaxID=2782352 RepID=A0AAP2D8Z3_9BACT|nr:ankyrin repeat domain-containing protein [Dawidia soli]MBT1687618.1 ankyrin repeat domain-containing protein [Dawidia soli]